MTVHGHTIKKMLASALKFSALAAFVTLITFAVFADTWTQTTNSDFSLGTITDAETAYDYLRLVDVEPASNWWDSNWAFRRYINVTNSTGVGLNDFQVKVVNPIIDETDLLGSWHLDGATSGAIANGATTGLGDTSGNSANCTASNANGAGMAWTTGAADGAVTFDGTDDYLSATLPTNVTNGTVMFWAKDAAGEWTHYAESNGKTYVNGVEQTFFNKFYFKTGTTLNLGRAGKAPNDSSVSGNLRLWVDASDASSIMKNSSNRVFRWNDKSGYSNHFTQTTTTRYPTWIQNIGNGRPAIKFTDSNGSSNFMENLNVSTNFTTPVTVFVVSRYCPYTGTVAENGRILSGLNNNWLLGFHANLLTRCFHEGWVYAGGTAANYNWYIYSSTTGSGGPTTFFENNTQIVSNYNGVTGPNGLSISGHLATSEFSNCDVSEIMVYNKVLTDAERRPIETYLATKYNITIANATYAYYNGSIDEFKIYNRTLTADEIKRQFNFRAKPNYNDLRFTTSAGVEMPYQMEKDGTFWVKVPSLPATTSTDIYMYYGNAAASFGGSYANNASATFPTFYDDLTYANEAAMLAGGWGKTGAPTLTFANSTINVNAAGIQQFIYKDLGAGIVLNNVVEVSAIATTKGTQNVALRTTFTGGGYDGTSSYAMIGNIASANYKWAANLSTTSADAQSNGFFHVYKFLHTGGTSYAFEDDIQRGTYTWTPPDGRYLCLGGQVSAAGTGQYKYNWARVRKVASVEPTAEVYAEQENLTYAYTKSITLSNTTGAALTSFQTKVVLDYNSTVAGQINMESGCRKDFADVRFGDGSGNVYPCWLESMTYGSTATYWVKLPTVATDTGTTLYIYYGNAFATSGSNGYATFDFFDDFSGSDLSRWINVNAATAPFVLSDGKLRIGATTNDSYLVANKSLGASGIVIECRMKAESLVNNSHPGIIWHANTSLGAAHRNDQVYVRPHTYNQSNNIQSSYYNGAIVPNSEYLGLFNFNTQYDIKVELVSANSIKFYRDGVNEASFAAQQFQTNTYVGLFAHAATSGNTVMYDDYRVRKYASAEPGISSTGVQTANTSKIGNWQKGARLRINNAGGAALTDYQFLFTVDTASLVTAGEISPDCSNIKFSDTNSFKEELWNKAYPHYIESGANTATTKIWVMVDSVAADATKDINMFYVGAPRPYYDGWNEVFSTTGAYAYEWATDANTAALWHFNNNWNDSSAYANTLTNVNTAFSTFYTKTGGYSAQFNGSNAYLWRNDSVSLSVANDMTLEYWIMPTNIASTRINPLEKSYYNEFGLTLEVDGSCNYYHGVDSGSYMGWTYTPPNTFINNKWVHIAITRNNTSKVLTCYVNGKYSGASTYTVNPSDGTSTMRIGTGYTGAYLNGYMDEVRVSSSVRSTADILKSAGNRKTAATDNYTNTSVIGYNYDICYQYLASGSCISPEITDAQWYQWGTLSFTKSDASNGGGAGTAVTVDVLDSSDDSIIASDVATGTDLNTLPAVADVPAIKLRANLSTSVSTNTPYLNDWTVTYTIDTTAPSAVTPALSDGGDSTITLTWAAATDDISGIQRYDIERALDSGGMAGSYTTIDSVDSSTLSYIDDATNDPANTPVPGNKYHYRITTVDWVDNETTGVSVTDNVAPDPNPGIPVLTTISTTRVDMTWTAATDTESGLRYYQIERAPDSSGSPGAFALIGETVVNSYSDNPTNNPTAPAEANTKYHYRISVHDYYSNSQSGTSATVWTMADMPVGVSASSIYHDRIVLSWQSGGAQYFFRIYRDGDSSTGTLIASTTSFSLTDYIVGSHSYYIYAVDGGGSLTNAAVTNGSTIPNMMLSVGSVEFFADEDDTGSLSSESFGIYNVSTGSFNWTVSKPESATWLTMAPTSGTVSTETDLVSLTPDLTGLGAGTYLTTITVTAGGSTYNTPQYVSVILTITALPPTITLNTSSFSFGGIIFEDNPASQTLQIWNSGGTIPLDWTITGAPGWLKLSSTSGVSDSLSDINSITLSAITSGLSPDDSPYSALLEVSSDMATNTPQTVMVTLDVFDIPKPEISTDPAAIYVTIPLNSASSSSLQLRNTGGQMLVWSAYDSANWISIEPVMGSTTSETDIISVSINTSSPVSSKETGYIYITDPNASNSPYAVPVYLTVIQNSIESPKLTEVIKPLDMNVTLSSINVPALVFAVNGMSANEPIILDEITVSSSGSGDESSDISAVKLFVDTDGDGLVTGADTQIGTDAMFIADDGTVSFTELALDITGSEPVQLIVSYSFSGTGALESDYSAEISSPEGLIVKIESSGYAVDLLGNFPISGRTLKTSLTGSLSVYTGPATPAVKTVAYDAEDVVIFQVCLETGDVEAANVDWISFSSSGTGSETAHLIPSGARLVEDIDADGAIDAGEPQLGTQQSFSTDNGQVVFSNLDKTIDKSSKAYWLLVYSFDGSAGEGSTFVGSVFSNSNVSATGVTSTMPLMVSGAPAYGKTITLTQNTGKVDNGITYVQSPGSVQGGGGRCLISSISTSLAFMAVIAATMAVFIGIFFAVRRGWIGKI